MKQLLTFPKTEFGRSFQNQNSRTSAQVFKKYNLERINLPPQ
jgi:hypothetical protein